MPSVLNKILEAKSHFFFLINNYSVSGISWAKKDRKVPCNSLLQYIILLYPFFFLFFFLLV